MKNIPENIYLQIGDEAVDCEDFDELSHEDITWSKDMIFNSDIKYTQQNIANELLMRAYNVRIDDNWLNDVKTYLKSIGLL